MSKTSTTRKKSAGSAARRESNPAQKAVEALESYEDALKQFRKGDYTKAASMFQKVATSYPAEREIADRAQMWTAVAKARSGPGAPKPKDARERYDHGVLALNDGHLDAAQEHFEALVGGEPKDDRGHYGLATVCALRGDATGASRHLSEAIAISQTNRVRALNDPDFDGLRDDADFMALLGKGPGDDR